MFFFPKTSSFPVRGAYVEMREQGGSVLQMFREDGHGTILRTYVCAHADGNAVSLGDALSGKDGRHKRARKRVAGAHGVRHLHPRRLKMLNGTAREGITAVDAAGEDDHIEIVFAENQPAFVFGVQMGIAKHSTNHLQFLIVDIQYVASSQRLLYNLFCIEVLAQVDVENADALAWCGVEEPVDGLS